MLHLGKKKENGMSIRNATMQRMKWFFFFKNHLTIIEKVQRGVKGEWGRNPTFTTLSPTHA
jgi:hypothetical protein